MEKLELKHIAPYLPYGLKIMHSDKIKKMNTGQGSSKYWIGIGSVINWQNTKAGCKPLLRPLSDLAKEIEHNGERFVPLLELAKIHEMAYISKFKTDIQNNIYGIKYEDIDGIETVLAYHEKNKSFGCHTILDKKFHNVTNQYDLFQFLLEWHFDIYNLIESGRAIDINTTTQ